VRFAVLDFETYYDKEYSLSKLSTESYVRDFRFEIILVGIKIDNGPAEWRTGTMEEIRDWFDEIDLWDMCVVAHNMFFDGLILKVHFGKLPRMLLCTRFMAMPFLKPYVRSVSLDSCLKYTNLGFTKGTEVQNMLGRTRASLSSGEMRAYGSYCANDCESEFALFRYLAPMFPKAEFKVMDLTLRMYLEPRLRLDANLLASEMAGVIAKKEQQLQALPPGITKDVLSSNQKFAELLEGYGIEVPMKKSPSDETKMIPALAKNDSAYLELQEEYEDDEVIGPMLAARVGVKSTMEVTRYQRLLDIATHFIRLRIPLLYYAAHTGRYGGMEGLNAQNFPRIDKSRMRFAIRAPKGYVVLAADLAQIEARITAWLAKQFDLVADFAAGEDIYSKFATRIFREETVKDRSAADKKRRFVGKTCILGLGYGMGASKLRSTLRNGGAKFELHECEHMVEVYRDTYSYIPLLWQNFDRALRHMCGPVTKMKAGPVVCMQECIMLPNGMPLHYHKLRHASYGTLKSKKLAGYEGYVYEFGGETRTLWGGKVTENVVQALAQLIIKDNMLKIAHTMDLNPVLQQHDELDYLVPIDEAEAYSVEIKKIMRLAPEWAPDLPIDVDVNYGPTLGDCK
jgi:hypothetical protein